MKKIILLALAAVIALSCVACSGASGSNSGEKSDASSSASEETKQPSASAAQESSKSSSTQPNASAATSVDAKDANLFNTTESPAPLGTWVCFKNKNYTSGNDEPFYMRITRVSRDQAEVQAAIDSYKGNRDFTLKEDQARDIELGLVEYEIFFAPDYSAKESGISIPNITFSATSADGKGFKTDGGMSYIGVGSAYGLDLNSSARPHPGDIVQQKSLFTILKNYDQSRYLFNLSWYDGEIVAGNERKLYFAAQ